MIMRKSFYIPFGEAHNDTSEVLQDISEYGLDVHDLLQCILNFWLRNGAYLTVEQAIEEIYERSTEKLMEMGYVEEGSVEETGSTDGRVALNVNEWMSVLAMLEYATEAYVKALKPFFDVIIAADSFYLPENIEISKSSDNSILLTMKVRKAEEEVLRVPQALLPLLKAKSAKKEDK